MRISLLSRIVLLCVIGLEASQSLLGQENPQALRPRLLAAATPSNLFSGSVRRVAAVQLANGLFSPGAAKRTASALAALRNGERISDTVPLRMELNLFPDRSLPIRWSNIERTDSHDGFVWYGEVLDSAMGSAVMVVSDEGRVQANFARGDGTMWQIRSLDDGSTWVREVDQSKFVDDPPALRTEVEEPAIAAEGEGIREAGSGNAALDDGSIIDVMVLYTPLARSRAGGASAMQQLVQLGVAETNQGYVNSGVTHRIRLVHSAEIAYTETGDLGRDLNAVTATNDGIMDNVHSLRNLYAADLVSLWVEGGDYCGMAWQLGTTTGTAARGFSVVGRDCATGYYSFGHEMGHNLGANHGSDDNTGPGLFAYSYAFKAPNQFRTVMAYPANCNCPRVNYWSNPNVRYNNIAAGRVPTGTNPAANYLTLNNTRLVVSRYRDSVAGGGTPPAPPPSGGSGAFPESAHPYADNFDNTWTYSITGATALNVTFDSRTSVEPGYDFIHVLNGQGQPIAGSPFTGTSLAGRTFTVQGNSVRIRLTSDDSVFDFGFRVTSITATGGATTLPRLVVTSVTAPASAQIGAQIAVRADFANQGNANAPGPFRLGFYWSSDRTITTGDVPGATCTFANGLAAAATTGCAGNITVPSSLSPGAWFLGAIVDDENRVNQSSRAGNAAASANPVQISGGVAAELNSPVPGALLNTATVSFQWDAGVGVSSYTLQVGRSATDSGFFNRNMGVVRAVSVEGLPRDGSTLFVRLISRIGTGDVTRSYNLRAALPVAGAAQPRIVVSAFTAPTDATLGVNLTGTSLSIANQSSAATGPFRVGYYYGRSANVTTRDVFSGWSCNFAEGLGPNATSTCAGEVGVPGNLGSGTWYIAAIADDQERLTQADRSGHMRANDNGATTVSGIAAAEMLSPSNGASLTGSSQTFRWNSGSGGNQFVLGLGTAAGETDINVIDAGGNLSLAVSSLPTNGRSIFVRLFTRFGEDWYYNDYSYRAANISAAQPRLVITQFTAPTSGTVGVDMQGTSVTVQNQGNGNAGAFQIGFYFGRSSSVSTRDLDSGWVCTVGNGLAAGQSFTCAGQIGVPAAISAGTWYLAGIADSRSAVDQSSRAGNVRVNDNGATVFSAGSSGSTVLPESPHPYADGVNQSWTYTVPGNPAQIRVSFDSRTSFETDWDFLYVYDGNNRQVSGSPFTGAALAGRTLTMAGPSFRVQLVTDDSVVDWGFRVTAAAAEVAARGPRLSITRWSGPTTGTIGQPYGPIQFTVRNDGEVRAEAFRTGYYWSTSANATAANSVAAGWFCNTANGLEPGATASCEGMIDIPASITPGTKYFTAIADDRNALTLTTREGAIRVNSNGATVITGTATSFPESTHPYQNDMDRTWTFTLPGNPARIQVTFDAQTAFEDDYDYLYVSGAGGAAVAGSPFTGRQLAGRTLSIPGATVNLRLVTDFSEVDWGFRISNITPVSADVMPDTIPSSGASVSLPDRSEFDPAAGQNTPVSEVRGKSGTARGIAMQSLRSAKPAPYLAPVAVDLSPSLPNRNRRE